MSQEDNSADNLLLDLSAPAPEQEIPPLDFYDGKVTQSTKNDKNDDDGHEEIDLGPVDASVTFPNDPLLVDDMPTVEREIDDDEVTPQESKPMETSFWKLSFYQQFFQTNQNDVLARMVRCFLPFPKNDFLALEKVDLWGAFWTMTTYFVMVVITSNVMGLLHFRAFINSQAKFTEGGGVPQDIEAWTADFSTVTVGAFGLYGYVLMFSTLQWLLMKWLGIPLTLAHCLSLYGYSFLNMIPLTLLGVATYDLVRWAVIGFSFLYSTVFICIQLFNEASKHLQGGLRVHLLTLLGVAIVPHILLGLSIKTFFYSRWLRDIVRKL